MADKTINQLTQATALTDGSLFVIEQNSTAKQANWGMMKNYISPGVAAQYSTSATYNVGDYVIYNGSLYRCNTAITTGEAWTAAHWTAAVLGNDVGGLKDQLQNYNAFNIVDFLFTGVNATHNGATYTWTGHACKVTGTTTSSVSVNNIIAFKSVLPSFLVPGKTYDLIYETNNTNIQLGFIFYNSSDVATYVNKTSSGSVTIPSSAVKWSLRLYIDANKNPAGNVTKIGVITAKTNAGLQAQLTDYIFSSKDKTANIPSALTYFRIADAYSSSHKATPANIPINSYCYTAGTRLSGFGTSDASYYWICCFANLVATGVREYVAIELSGSDIIIGWSTDSGATVSWRHRTALQSLKVLTIGSSFGQDCMTYVPYIVDTLTDRLDLTVGIAYASGGTISQYNGWFDTADTVYYYKHTQGTTAWTSASSKTLKAILTDEKWDVILINQAADSLWNLSSYADLNEYLDKISVYAATQNGKSAKFGMAFPQVALRDPTNSTYANVISCAENVLATTPIEFITPCVTAIQNARGTSLDDIGSYASVSPDGKGHLCADGPSSSPSMPGHLQEGLPCLIAGYTTALTILKLVGIDCAGILGNQLRPTSDYLSDKNIPGANGTSVGVTDENCLLGQKCAIAAIKKPFEVTTIDE